MQRLVLTAVLFICLACACHRPTQEEIFTFTEIYMDTLVEVTLAGEDRKRAEAMAKEVFSIFAQVEEEMSRFRADSRIAAINKGAGSDKWTPISTELAEVLTESRRIAQLSDGAFDPTLAEVNRLWAFDRGGEIPSPEALETARGRIGWQNLEVAEGRARLTTTGSGVDLGGIAKGYAVDRGADLLIAGQVSGGIVNAGGDMRLIGTRPGGGPWRIGIQHPRDPEGLLEVIRATDVAVVSSGDYERYFIADGRRYHHILDPSTGYPVTTCQSVTVVADRAMVADGLATAAFVFGPEAGLDLLQRAGCRMAIIVAADGTVHRFDKRPLDTQRTSSRDGANETTQ